MKDWPWKLWYQKNSLCWLLWPFSLFYSLLMQIRRFYLGTFIQKQGKTPIIVVGNITVGGVGKTPLVIVLAQKLTEKGLKVGIVSRGYGSRAPIYPYEVKPDDSAELTGDEPLLIAIKTGCPVVIAPKRMEAVYLLEKKHQVQIIISDDGLQHYAMGRTLEIAVIDGLRGLGNGLCLPAGPLREPASRLNQVDMLVVNEGIWPHAFPMHLKPLTIHQLGTNKIVTAQSLKGTIAALAAIGNPQRFFNTLQQMGLTFQTYSWPDHYRFKPQDFSQVENIMIMTEKDAVKCKPFARDNMYYLAVEAELDEAFWKVFYERLQGYLT